MEVFFSNSFTHTKKFLEILTALDINDREKFAALKNDSDGKIVQNLVSRLFVSVFTHNENTPDGEKSLIEDIFKSQLTTHICDAINLAASQRIKSTIHPDHFTKQFTAFYGGAPSPTLSAMDLVDVKAIAEDLGSYRELKLSRKTLSSNELKMVTLIDGTTAYSKESSSTGGREPKNLLELFSVLIPYLVTVSSIAGIRTGAISEEYIARLTYIALRSGEINALRYDRTYRQRLSTNAHLVEAASGMGYSESVVSCFLKNQDSELITEAFSTSQIPAGSYYKLNSNFNVKPNVRKFLPSEMCPYGSQCELLRKGQCKFGPTRHAEKPKDETNNQEKRGKGNNYKTDYNYSRWTSK
jgi:hypothetical protein